MIAEPQTQIQSSFDKISIPYTALSSVKSSSTEWPHWLRRQELRILLTQRKLYLNLPLVSRKQIPDR